MEQEINAQTTQAIAPEVIATINATTIPEKTKTDEIVSRLTEKPSESEVEKKGEILPEVKAEPAKEPEIKKEPDNYASRFAAMARKDRMLNLKQQQIKAQETELNDFRQARNLAKKNPIEAIEKVLGIKYDDVAQYILRDGKPSEKTKLDELAEKQAIVDAKLKEIEEREFKQKQEAQYNIFIGNLDSAAKANPEKYEMVNMFGNEAIELAFDVMENYFRETLETTGEGILLKTDEALNLVEDYYTEKLKPVLNAKKFKTQTKPTVEEKIEAGKEKKTLTNEQSTHQPPKLSKMLDDEESKALMISMLKHS